MTGRYEDWPRRLDAALEAARGRPFRWGTNDCLLFAGAVVRDLTGRDPAARWRGLYWSAHSALGLMARHGGMATMVTRELGEPLLLRQANRGDVVMRCDARGPALGVAVGGGRAAFVSPRGLVLRPLDECIQAWPV